MTGPLRTVHGATLALMSSVALVGCALSSGVGSGGSCVRSEQCDPGLVCNAGKCTGDLDGFGMGMVPMDAGPPPDAGIPADAEIDAPLVDAEPVDAGPPPPDAGPSDAGPPPVDAGLRDAGPPPVDVGPPDAGTEEPDAGTEEPDAGTEEDAG